MPTFPNDPGATEFLRNFKTQVVKPGKWQSLNQDTPPPVLLDIRTAGDEARDQEARDRAANVVEALEQALKISREEVFPYAKPQHPEQDRPPEELLTLEVGRQLAECKLKRRGTLKLRDFDLVARMLERVRELADQGNLGELDGRTMRNWLYRNLMENDDNGGLPHALYVCHQGLATLPGIGAALNAIFGRFVFVKLPMFLWSAWWTHRMLCSRRYGWWRKWLDVTRPYPSAIGHITNLMTAQAPSLRAANSRPNALFELERMVLRALLSDLHRARAGRVGPWRRRRRTRRVVLLELPRAGTPEAAPVERFLQTYRDAYHEPGCSSLFVAGAGAVSGYPQRSGQEWNRKQDSLTVAAQNLRPDTWVPVADAPWLLAPPIADEYFVGSAVCPGGPEVRPITLRGYRWGPRPEAVSQLLVAAAVVTGVVGPSGFCDRPPNPHCLNGEVSAHGMEPKAIPDVKVGRNGLKTDRPGEPYKRVRAAITELNEAALDAEKSSRKVLVRTVVHFTPPATADDKEGFNGAIAELRGVWMAQARINHAAEQDADRIRLVVKVRETGRDFEGVEGEAEKVIDEAEENRRHQDSRTIIGVVGFAESRDETLKAAELFDKARIPVVGTTATAVAMRTKTGYYRPLAPNNDREAQIEAAFARGGHLIEQADKPGDNTGSCDTAQAAVVVKDQNDLYSNELGSEFARNFGSGTTPLNFPSSTVNAREAAEQVCRRKRHERRTIVFWASRVERFKAFLNAYYDTRCAYQNLTVIGGNELTNAALKGEYDDTEEWLRLYHGVHVLPVGHAERNDEAEGFGSHDAYYAGQDDPWVNDGRGPLAFDALRLFGIAADEANASNRNEVDSSSVKSELDESIELEGASGAIRYPEDNIESTPPKNKGFVIVRYTKDGPRTVLYCGRFGLNESDVSTWGPNDTKCPTDG